MIIALPASPTMTFLSYYVAVDKGFFAAEGVDVEYAHISEGKEKMLRLFAKGDVHFLWALWEMVEFALKGMGEVRGLCGSVASAFILLVRPEIRSVADLKGKTIMAGGMVGAGSNTQTRYALQQAGLKPDLDVNIVVGDLAAKMNAFQNPQIDAFKDRMQFWYFAEKAGWHQLRFDYPNLLLDSGGLSASLKMIKEKPETVKKVVKGIVLATEYIKENREETIELAQKVIPYLNREEIAGQYDVMHDYFTADIKPATIDFMVKATGTVMGLKKRLKFEELVDLSFLHQANDELGVS